MSDSTHGCDGEGGHGRYPPDAPQRRDRRGHVLPGGALLYGPVEPCAPEPGRSHALEAFPEDGPPAGVRESRSQAFCVETADGEKTPLFEPLSPLVQASVRQNFAKSIFGILVQDRFDFSNAFEGGFDFYSAIFEYLISKYNVASGTYAEYFTPQTVSHIIAKILIGMSEKIEAAEIYDPAAGSGSLILHLAHELGQEGGMNRTIVYTQDISTKSTRFLRLNMMLNGKTESLGNIVRGDTLERPAHYAVEHEPESGLKKFSYITTNPPFKTDFSVARDRIEQKWADTDRFFSGVPKIPAKKKDSMAIYLLFIQHVLYSLNDKGKAAIVVPTGFLTAKGGIEKGIRDRMVDERMLKGVISMPSNIFANMGTNVSVIFLDKANKSDRVIPIDASKLGEQVKEGKNKKTVLRDKDVSLIIDSFLAGEDIEDFAVSVPFEDIKAKNCSFSAGQYFEVKIDYVDITEDEFNEKMDGLKKSLGEKFAKSSELQKQIMEQLGGLKFEG